MPMAVFALEQHGPAVMTQKKLVHIVTASELGLHAEVMVTCPAN